MSHSTQSKPGHANYSAVMLGHCLVAAKVFCIVYWPLEYNILARDAPILKDRNEKEKEVATDLSFDYRKTDSMIESLARIIREENVASIKTELPLL